MTRVKKSPARFFALLIAAMLICTMLPMTAFAKGGNGKGNNKGGGGQSTYTSQSSAKISRDWTKLNKSSSFSLPAGTNVVVLKQATGYEIWSSVELTDAEAKDIQNSINNSSVDGSIKNMEYCGRISGYGSHDLSKNGNGHQWTSYKFTKNDDGSVTMSCNADKISHIDYSTWSGLTNEKDMKPDDPKQDDPKISEPGMDKQTGNAEDKDKIGTVKPGDTVNFTLNSTVGEDMADYLKDENGSAVTTKTTKYTGTYKLTFHDQMNENLTWDGKVTSVKVGETELEANQYTLTKDATDGCTFDLTIDCVALLNAKLFTYEQIGTVPVVISYSATVDEDAPDKAKLLNTAWVTENKVESKHDTTPGDVVNPPTPTPNPPHTGGSGTMIFTVLGIVLMCGAGVAHTVSRKKRNAR